MSADGKLHIDIIFCHTALEVVQLLDHVENIVGGQVFLGTEQPQVGHIDFERVNIAIVFQRLFDLLHLEDPRDDAGQTEPFDGIFEFRGPSALLDQLILEAGILLRELDGNAVIGKSGLLDFIQVVVFAHIIEIACEDGVLGMADKDMILCLHELLDALRHTAYHKVLTVDSHCRIVEGSGHRRICLKASFDLLCQGLFAHGKHKFLHIHRVERLHVHLAHRK